MASRKGLFDLDIINGPSATDLALAILDYPRDVSFTVRKSGEETGKERSVRIYSATRIPGHVSGWLLVGETTVGSAFSGQFQGRFIAIYDTHERAGRLSYDGQDYGRNGEKGTMVITIRPLTAKRMASIRFDFGGQS